MMTELNVNPATGIDESRHQQNEQDDGSTKFPTPSPTVSPSGSPHSHDGSSSANYQMATSSELAYALNNEQQQSAVCTSRISFRCRLLSLTAYIIFSRSYSRIEAVMERQQLLLLLRLLLQACLIVHLATLYLGLARRLS